MLKLFVPLTLFCLVAPFMIAGFPYICGLHGLSYWDGVKVAVLPFVAGAPYAFAYMAIVGLLYRLCGGGRK